MKTSASLCRGAAAPAARMRDWTSDG